MLNVSQTSHDDARNNFEAGFPSYAHTLCVQIAWTTLADGRLRSLLRAALHWMCVCV